MGRYVLYIFICPRKHLSSNKRKGTLEADMACAHIMLLAAAILSEKKVYDILV